jgi:hypothetical protein
MAVLMRAANVIHATATNARVRRDRRFNIWLLKVAFSYFEELVRGAVMIRSFSLLYNFANASMATKIGFHVQALFSGYIK